MEVREAIRLIERDGRELIAIRGSHRQYKHALKQSPVSDHDRG